MFPALKCLQKSSSVESILGNIPIFTFFFLQNQTQKGFPGGSAGKESACNAGDLGSIHGLGRFSGEGNGSPLQYSGLENSMDCIVHGVADSDMTERLSLSPSVTQELS